MTRKPRSPRVSLALSISFGSLHILTVTVTILGALLIFLASFALLMPSDKVSSDKASRLKEYGAVAISLATAIVLAQPFWAVSRFLSRKHLEFGDEYTDYLLLKPDTSYVNRFED